MGWFSVFGFPSLFCPLTSGSLRRFATWLKRMPVETAPNSCAGRVLNAECHLSSTPSTVDQHLPISSLFFNHLAKMIFGKSLAPLPIDDANTFAHG
jgi:hypothetical protein